jgi:carboxyl-terminal processing protease
LKREILSKIAVWLGILGLGGLGAWQASLQARSNGNMSPLVVSGAPANGQPVLSCKEVRSRVAQFLDLHYLYRAFDEELSRRTFERLFQTMDPTRSYFLASDIQGLRSNETKLPQMLKKNDCSLVNTVRNLYTTRLEARTESIMALLAGSIDLEADETLSVAKPSWAASPDELDERWRKRIKLQLGGLLTTESEEKARQRLQKRYSLLLQVQKERSQDEVLSQFLNAFASSLDPHSSHLLPADQEDFNIRLGNRLEGIGATLREEDGYITVQQVMPGGAAGKDGRLREGDRIIAVDPGHGQGLQDVVDMELSKAVRLIRGPKGSVVVLHVLRQTEEGSKRMVFEITRDAIELAASRARAQLMVVDGRKLGVVRLPSFYTDFNCRGQRSLECSGASGDVYAGIKEMQQQGAEGIILDLRSNGGGDLRESILLSGLFIETGSIVQTVDRRRITRSQDDTDKEVQYNGPLLVFVNKYSASASEIVAGALQDYGRALIVGDEHTYGKATVQIVQELQGTDGRTSDGALKVTQSKFYRPSGRTNQNDGVQSDIVIPSALMASEVGERENDYVLPADRIKPAASFEPVANLTSLLPDLGRLSSERIMKSKDFQKLNEQVEKFRQRQRDGIVSSKTSQSENAVQEQEERNKEKAVGSGNAYDPSDFALHEAGRILLDAIRLRAERDQLHRTGLVWVQSGSAPEHAADVSSMD